MSQSIKTDVKALDTKIIGISQANVSKLFVCRKVSFAISLLLSWPKVSFYKMKGLLFLWPLNLNSFAIILTDQFSLILALKWTWPHKSNNERDAFSFWRLLYMLLLPHLSYCNCHNAGQQERLRFTNGSRLCENVHQWSRYMTFRQDKVKFNHRWLQGAPLTQGPQSQCGFICEMKFFLLLFIVY